MRKIYSFLVLLFSISLIFNQTKAQTAKDYVFTASTGASLNQMSGATTIVAASVDDVPSTLQNIGFSFVYEGISYTQYSASPDGFLRLGSTAATSQFTNAITSTTNPAKLFPFWDDMATGVGGSITSLVTGTAPNRRLIVQWYVTCPRAVSGNANTTFQAVLYETSNKIEFIYGAGVGPSTSASIGINGVTTTNYISISTPGNTASNTVANDINTLLPTDGTMFTFTPPPPCSTPTAQPTALIFSNITSTSIGIGFTAASPAPTNYLVVRTSTNTPPVPVDGTTYTVGANTIGQIEFVGSGVTYVSSGLIPSTNYYYWVFSYNTTPGTCSPAYNLVTPLSGMATTAVAGSITSTSQGGLWSSTATWVGGVVPGTGDNVIIADGATVTIDGLYTVNALTIGQGNSGVLQWNATTNALTVRNDFTIAIGARLHAYTTGSTGQTINVGGNFTNNGYANLALGSTLLNFNGSQIGGSSSQTLGGTGVFEGNGTSGIIRSLFFQTTGNTTISTTQNLITSSFAHGAGSLNTNGKLTIDNTAQVYGRPLNTQVANVVVTNMGTTAYTNAPVVFGTAVTLWTVNGTATLNTRYFSGDNVYIATTAGTFDAATAPTHTSGIVSNGTASLLWVGTLGTLGNPFQQTAVTVGTQYFYGDNLYVCTVAGTPSATAPPTHTSGAVASGTATFLYVGSAAKVSVNFNNGTVRSLTLTSAGSGYSSAPSITFSLNGGAGAGAAATVVQIQSIAGPANSLTQKSGIATISGGININSTQGATAFSGVGAVSTTGGGVNYTIAPTVGFAGPTAINLVTDGGSGYTTAPTVTVTGGTLVSGTALTSTNFTVVVANGKVVSTYLNTATTATYSVPPALAFSAGNATLAFPSGCWPTATAVIGANGQITNFNITNSGYGYVAAPTVGIGTTSGTALGGTFTTAATAPTARIALYNATLGFFIPAPSNAIQDGSVLPANGKLNAITMNSALGANFTNNIELFGSSPLTLTAGELNLGSNSLTFSHPSYAGTSGTATSSVSASAITLNNPGGSLTRTFPYFPAVAIATGTGSLATGSTVTTITTTRTAKPTGSIAGGGVNATGTRAYRVQSNTGSNFGVNPTVTLNFNVNDSLTVDNPNLYIGQSASLTGPWTIRSASSGTGALPATGSRITATTGVGPIVPTGDDYFAWLAAEQCSGTPATGVIATTTTSVCAGTTVAFTSSVFTVGVGMTYRWQTSTDSINWDNTTVTNAGNFSIRAVDSIWVRRVDSCANSSLFSTSNAIKISMAPGSPLPWTEGFEGIATVGAGVLPDCWSIQNISGTLPTSSTTNTSDRRAPRTGTKYYHTQWSSTSWVYTPGFDLVAGTSYDFSFYMANLSGVAGFTMDVAYGSNPSDVAMINPLLSATAVTNTPYEQFKYTFTPSTTGKYHFGIKSTSTTSTPWYLSFDDFKLEITPSCNVPTNLQLANLTSNSVDVSWDPPTAGSAPQSYSVYYSTSSTAPTLITVPTLHGLTNPSISLSGLISNTTYYLWVRSKCSSSDSSSWSNLRTFTTLCNAVTTFPYSEGFNTVGQLPACFTATAAIANPAQNWQAVAADATNGAGAPDEGAAFLRMNYFNAVTANNPYILTSIPFNLGAQDKRMRFSLWMGSTSGTNNLALEITTDGGGSWNLVETYTANPLNTTATAPWDRRTVDLSSYTGQTIQFRLRATSNFGSGRCNIGFDNLVIENIPSCNEPTNVLLSNVTSTGVDLTWDAPTAGTSPASYSIFYSTTNTTPSLTQAPTVRGINGPASVLSGLTPATTYYLWVRSICSATDSSSWSAVRQFTTLCTPVTSFSQSFDGVTVPALPSCWLKVGTTGTVVTQATGAFTTPNALNMNSTNTTNIAMVSMPPVSNSDAGTHRLRFRIRASATVGGTIEAGYLTDPLDQATFVSLGSFATTSTTVYNDFEVTPINTPPGVTTLAFRHTGSPANAVLIDNVVYEQIPTCNEPTNVQAANITTTTADLTWDAPTAGSSPISYSLYYSTTNTPPTLTTAPTLAGVNGPAVNLTGLNPASTYFLWVRSKCSATDSSGWSNLRTFTTQCAVITSLPWNEGFEGVTAPAALVFPNCWTYERSAGTGGPGTSAVNDANRSPRTGANYLYAQWSTTAWVFTPQFQLNAGTSYDFSFYMQNKNGTAGFTMDVAYGTAANEAGMSNSLQAGFAANNTSYTLFKYTFTPTTSGAYNFGIKSTSPTSAPWYLSFDDFRLEVTPSCSEPTAITASNITTSSADVSWTAPPSSGVTGYTWELRTSGAAGSGPTGLVTSGTTANTSVNLSGLNGTTAYTFYVRTNCTSPSVSSFGSVSFNTLITNDDCSGAVQVYATGTINATTIGATQSLPPSLCSGFTSSAAGDVWFKFEATQNGSVTINTANLDVVIEAYSGTCTGLTSLGCVDATGTTETFTLSNLVAGSTYYFRVYAYGALTVQGNFTLTLTGPALPAAITNFKGEKRGLVNVLSWTTSTEVNNAGFELQRSSDGVNLTSLGFIKSKGDNGNSNQLLNYSFNDERPLSSTGFYRLKQIDKDGKFNYSSIVVIKSDRKGDLLVGNIYPNPVTSILNLTIESVKNTKVEIVVTNTLGMKVYQQPAIIVTGNNLQTLNMSKLAAGIYHVQIISSNGEVLHAGKVIKQ